MSVLFSEALYESDELSKEAHDAAALLVSQVYYYLGEYEEALSFALGAGSAFEAHSRASGAGEYVETIVCKSDGLLFACTDLTDSLAS